MHIFRLAIQTMRSIQVQVEQCIKSDNLSIFSRTKVSNHMDFDNFWIEMILPGISVPGLPGIKTFETQKIWCMKVLKNSKVIPQKYLFHFPFKTSDVIWCRSLELDKFCVEWSGEAQFQKCWSEAPKFTKKSSKSSTLVSDFHVVEL